MNTATKIYGLALGALVAGAAAAQSDSATKFLEEAIQGNLAEVQIGELAQQRGKSEDARDFGETLAKDHSKALDKSVAVAKSVGVRVPTEPSASAKRTYDMLSKLSGDEFDREFATHMVEDHEKDIGQYRAAAQDKSQKPIADYAKDTLSTLEKHLKAAESLAKDLQAQATTAPKRNAE
jgi:putative membrane protein